MRAKSEKRREIILKAATKLFLKYGYERMSMSELQRQLGYSKATLYNYFASKQELFIECMDNSAKQHIKELHEITRTFSDDNIDIWLTLERFGISLVKMHLRPNILQMNRILIAEGERFGFAEKIYVRGPQQCTTHLTMLFNRALEQGIISNVEATTLAIQYQSLLKLDLLQKRLYGLKFPISDEEIQQSIQAAIITLRLAYEAKN